MLSPCSCCEITVKCFTDKTLTEIKWGGNFLSSAKKLKFKTRIYDQQVIQRNRVVFLSSLEISLSIEFYLNIIFTLMEVISNFKKKL